MPRVLSSLWLGCLLSTAALAQTEVPSETPTETPAAPSEKPAPAVAPSEPPTGAAAPGADAEGSVPSPVVKKRKRTIGDVATDLPSAPPVGLGAPPPATPGQTSPTPPERKQSAPATLPTTPPAPTPPPPAVVAGPSGPNAERDAVHRQAQNFFARLFRNDVREVAKLCAYPFQLEARRVESEEALVEAWNRALKGKRTDLLSVRSLEVLSPEEMQKKFGPPPSRLANLPWRAPKTYLVVAELGGHPAVAIFRHEAAGPKLVGYAD